IWQFQGGASYETEWQTSSASMINLFSPFERTNIQLIGDINEIEEKGFRAVAIQLEYPFFGKTLTPQKVIKKGDDLSEAAFEVTLPLNNRKYSYTMTWIGNGKKLTNNYTDDSGIIFID